MIYSYCREVLCSPLPPAATHESWLRRISLATEKWLQHYALTALPGYEARFLQCPPDEPYCETSAWDPLSITAYIIPTLRAAVPVPLLAHATVVDLYRWQLVILNAPMVPQHIRIRPPLGWLCSLNQR